MPAAGWFDDGSGRKRWWDGSAWTDRYQDAEEAAPDAAASPATAAPSVGAPLRIFTGNGTGGSVALSIYPEFVEFEHNNYVVAVPRAQVGPVSYSKKLKSPYDGVAVTPNIDFHTDDPKGVYEYLRGYLAGQ